MLEGAAIRVGTENRAKLGAVRDAFEGFAAEEARLELVPVGVESDVPEQPIGWDEIVSGARNRARAAFASGPCGLAVGIEDGLARLDEGPSHSSDPSEGFFNVGCAWITDGTRDGHGFSSGFAYPAGALLPAVRDQAPIGDLFDDHWSQHRPPEADVGISSGGPSGRSGGNIGRLTGGRLDRSAYGAQAVACALIRFLHTDLYD